jgi:hypothetical protein
MLAMVASVCGAVDPEADILAMVASVCGAVAATSPSPFCCHPNNVGLILIFTLFLTH